MLILFKELCVSLHCENLSRYFAPQFIAYTRIIINFVKFIRILNYFVNDLEKNINLYTLQYLQL